MSRSFATLRAYGRTSASSRMGGFELGDQRAMS